MSEFKDAVQAVFENTQEMQIAGATESVWESVVLALGGEDVTAVLVGEGTTFAHASDASTAVTMWVLSRSAIASVEIAGISGSEDEDPRRAACPMISVRRLDTITRVRQFQSLSRFSSSMSEGPSNPLFQRGAKPTSVSLQFADGSGWSIDTSYRADRSPFPALLQLFQLFR